MVKKCKQAEEILRPQKLLVAFLCKKRKLRRFEINYHHPEVGQSSRGHFSLGGMARVALTNLRAVATLIERRWLSTLLIARSLAG